MKYLTLIFACLFMLGACSDEKTQPNQLSPDEVKEGWVLLFDGKSTDGWHLYNKGKTASAWLVENGELHCKPDAGLLRGDLVTDGTYENFELKFEWKIAEGGNSGVFINVAEKPENPTTWSSGPEYQLLDHAHQDFDVLTKRSGGLFGFPWQNKPLELNTSGEWNESAIRQQNGKVAFYLNGHLTIQQDLTTQAWQDMIAATHFKNFPEFGQHTKGHIALQDWAKGIAFRNIKIKTL